MLVIPLLGVQNLLKGILYWRADRDQAVVYLFVACFICLVIIGVFCK